MSIISGCINTKRKLEILRTGFVIYFFICLFIFILSRVNTIYSIVLNAMIFLYGILLIIFRREAIIILYEHKNSFKTKHPKLGQIYNPGIVALVITGAASSLFWISLIGVLIAYVSNVWLIKFLHTHLGFKGNFLLSVADVPYALFSAVLFAVPFILINRRRLFLSPVIFMVSFLVTLFLYFSIADFGESWQENLALIASNILVWNFAGLFILFAWLHARIRNMEHY